MNNGILSRFTSRMPPTIASAPPVAILDDDTDDMLRESGPIGAQDDCLLGHTMMIEYVDANHHASCRRVTILGFDLEPPVVIRARCHERRANRSFRLDRVTTIIDALTGEVFERPYEYFLRRFGVNFDELFLSTLEDENRMGAILKHVAPGLTLLGGLASSDGFFHPEEIEAIARYCDAELTNSGVFATDVEMQSILDHAGRFLVPSVDEFRLACATIAKRGNLRPILRSLREVIDADGLITADEMSFYQEIESELTLLAL